MKKDDLVPHHKNALQLLDKLETVKLEHVLKSANKMANTFANLAATLALGLEESITISICGHWAATSPEDGDEEEVKTITAYKIYKEDWRQPLIDYLAHEKFLSYRLIKQKSNGEFHVFYIVRGPCTGAVSSVSACDA